MIFVAQASYTCNMNLIRRIFLFLSFPLVFISCYTTHTLPVEIVRPAEISLPENLESLLILNRSLLVIPDTLLNGTTIVIESSPEYLYNIASTEAILSMAHYINEIPSGIYVLPEHILEMLPEDSIYVKGVFTPEEIRDITFELGVTGLITLDYLRISDSLFTREYHQLFDREYRSFYVAAFQRNITVLIRFYDILENEIVDEYILEDSLTFFAPNSTWAKETAVSLLIMDTDFVKSTYMDAAWQIGFGYARRITPVYVPEERLFYSGKLPWLKKGGKFILETKWKDAEDLMLKYSQHENSRKAAAAFYNLAIISEMENDLQLARFYAEMSLKKYHTLRAQDYHRLLEKRIEEKPVIDRQLVF